MVDSTPPPEGDRLIERLAALGPVLDDLYDEAASSGDAQPPTPGEHGLRRPPRRRRASAPRRRALAAAAILLVLAAGAAIVAAGRDGDTITTGQTTTTTEFTPSAELAALVADRVDGMETCGPAPTKDEWQGTWPKGWKLVNASDCELGWVQVDVETVRPVPVFADAKVGSPKGYWSPSTGWITLEEYTDPEFDIGQYRAAYQAELDSRSDSGGN